MNSQTLKENGFSDCIPLKDLSITKLPSEGANVFALIDKETSEKDTSDILYIGRTKKLAKRIFGGYIGGRGCGKTIARIHDALFEDGYLKNTCISWIISEDPKAKQKQLLAAFKKEHGMLPLWNSSSKKRPQKDLKPEKTQTPSAPEKPKTLKPNDSSRNRKSTAHKTSKEQTASQ